MNDISTWICIKVTVNWADDIWSVMETLAMDKSSAERETGKQVPCITQELVRNVQEIGQENGRKSKEMYKKDDKK